MIPPVTGGRRHWRTVAVILLPLLALFAAAVALWLAVPGLLAGRIRAVAAEHGLAVSWRTFTVRLPLTLSARGMTLVRALGDTTVAIDSLELAIDPLSALTLAPRPTRVAIAGARFGSGESPEADPDLAPPPRHGGRNRPDRLPRIREEARRAARLLLLDPASITLSLRDVTLMSSAAADDPHTALHIDSLDLGPHDGDIRLTARGVAGFEDDTPFTADLDYRPRDGRLLGGADFQLRSPGARDHLAIGVDGRISRGGSPRALRLEDGSTITLGPVPLRVSGFVAPDAPRVRFALAAYGLRPDALVRSVPATLLGPLTSVRIRGAFDYSLEFDLDLERPDSVSFDADVTPHELALDPAATGLRLSGLDQPFVAEIHLPRGRMVTRELSIANPHFRTLGTIDSTLWHAVVANEDGGFFHHRGFNTGAVKEAIAENLRAGAYRRGAGTITMQIARNLYLGHERTLSRKAQEVILAWVLEHLAGVTKQRLLEIYLNIIEWGPDVHGADEACQYYFGHGADRVTVGEALFLATVVPAPTKWKYRCDTQGVLHPFERAQMHFIGRAMVAKGWLDSGALPPAESLQVELRGPARDLLLPPAGAPADSAGPSPGALETDGEPASH